jgi:hypothetical protein
MIHRCCNNIFGYCIDPELSSSEEAIVGFSPFRGQDQRITAVIFRCNHLWKTCPFFESNVMALKDAQAALNSIIIAKGEQKPT